MKKIISFSLWGNNPKYTVGAIKNAEIAAVIYPDWECRYYIGSSTNINTVNKLQSLNNTNIILMEEHGDWSGMFWRFMPAFDSGVDIMISRDTDSRLSYREKSAVDEWLLSNKDFHIMRDHPHHNTAILGGMWGCRNNLLTRLQINMIIPANNNFWQVDQNFLREYVYPKVRDYSLIHDTYNLFDEPQSQKFSQDRTDKGFVGEIYDENDNRHPDHYTLL